LFKQYSKLSLQIEYFEQKLLMTKVGAEMVTMGKATMLLLQEASEWRIHATEKPVMRRLRGYAEEEGLCEY